VNLKLWLSCGRQLGYADSILSTPTSILSSAAKDISSVVVT